MEIANNGINTLNSNVFNDIKLIKLLNENFNTNEKELFTKIFNIYKLSKSNNEQFTIDLDSVYEWIGFNRKDHAKRVLINKFKENINFIIKNTVRYNTYGRQKEQILMSIETFKNLCTVTKTTNSKQIHECYVKMENVINNYCGKQTDIDISDNDEILQLLIKNCNENEKEMFTKSYNLYKLYKNNKDDYIIDLDNIYEWIGFSTKGHAKRRLIDKFKENQDYIIKNNGETVLLRSEEQVRFNKKEQILMKINTFKKFCMIASTTKSMEIYDYYIKMEDIINNYYNKQTDISDNSELLNNDRLLQLLNENFNDDEQQLFITQFKLYLNYGDDDTKYIIDLDNIYEWIGFSRKDPAKRLLEDNFNKYDDYRLFHLKVEKSFGRPKEQILMNVNTFKELCVLASTDKAKQIRKYYIKMESIYNKYLKEKLIEHNKMIQNKDKELQDKDNQISQLQLTNNQFNEKKETKYEEIEKNEYVYVFSTDKPGTYKIGKSKDPSLRKRGIQTGQVDEINILFKYNTHNMSILEDVAHYILDEYRCKSRREFFRCKLDHIINVLNILGNTINVLKSSYEEINILEIKEKLLLIKIE